MGKLRDKMIYSPKTSTEYVRCVRDFVATGDRRSIWASPRRNAYDLNRQQLRTAVSRSDLRPPDQRRVRSRRLHPRELRKQGLRLREEVRRLAERGDRVSATFSRWIRRYEATAALADLSAVGCLWHERHLGVHLGLGAGLAAAFFTPRDNPTPSSDTKRSPGTRSITISNLTPTEDQGPGSYSGYVASAIAGGPPVRRRIHDGVSMNDRGVTFRTKNGDTVTVPPQVFLHRFLQHVLPDGFVKIRHYGLMASSNVNTKLQRAHELLTAPACAADAPLTESTGELLFQDVLLDLTGIDMRICPACHNRSLIRLPLPTARSRAPPLAA